MRIFLQCLACRNLGVSLFLVDLFVQSILPLKPCVQISNIFTVGFLHINRFWRKKIMKKLDVKTTSGACFFSYLKAVSEWQSKTAPLAGERTHLFLVSQRQGRTSRGRKKRNAFFSFIERHGRASRKQISPTRG